jgi:hypothetical protein
MSSSYKNAGVDVEAAIPLSGSCVNMLRKRFQKMY